MSNLNVTFLGKAYSLPEDILVYIDLLDFANSVQAQLMAAFSRKLGQSDSGFVTDQDFADDINQQVKKFIGKLCEHGIFNRTVNDYLKENKGYQLISDVNKEAFSKSIDLLKREMESWKAGYEDAMYKKESSITGMGFSIWSGSLINHALYAAMQASTLDKQEKAASKQYQKDMDALQAKLDSQFGDEKSKYINNVYIPHMETATMAFVYELLDRYLSDLIANHKFDAEALKYVDIERSNDLLGNLSLSTNKKAILESAFMACPFNFAVYQNAMKHELLDYKSFQTAKIFNHGDRILAGLKESWGKVAFPTNFYIDYQCINQWAMYVGKTPLELLRSLTETYATGVVKAYERIADMLSNSSLCHKLMQECSENAILGGSAICSAKAHEYVDHIVSADVWSQLLYSCGHVDLLDRIKVLIPEDVEIVRKADVDRYFTEQLTSAFEQERLTIVVQIDERKKEARRQAAEQHKASLLKQEEITRRAKKQKKIVASVMVALAVSIVSVIFVITYVVPSNRYMAANQLLADGEYEEAIVAFTKIENYKDSCNKVEVAKQALIEDQKRVSYNNAISWFEIGEYQKALDIFEMLGDYDDSADRVNECRTAIWEAYYADAKKLYDDGQYKEAISILRKMGAEEQANEVFCAWAERMGNAIAAGYSHSVGLCSDGTVVTVGERENELYNVSNWKNIISVSAGALHTVGLHSDGTVVAVGYNASGQCDVSSWTDIVAISAGRYHTVGLRLDGTVVAAGDKNWGDGSCDTQAWRDIVAIAAGDGFTIALCADGTIVTTGDNDWGQCDTSEWSNIIAVSAGISHSVGLLSDGTVVASGDNRSGQCDVSSWSDIVAISAGQGYTVGLRSDGTVVAIGDNWRKLDVSDWRNIVALSAGQTYTLGLCADGTVVATGDNDDGQCNISSWNNIKTPK